ncbi:MAG: hypothetical protein KAT56_07140, partial [Sedimentisphaerales bacterium]|nr:hypothetical protein [Sedimentisphaerales bacterium]
MPTAQQIETALTEVIDQKTFVNKLLVDALGWPIEGKIEGVEDISFGWSAAELRAEGLSEQLLGGSIRQLQPLEGNQPWGIFLLEFKNPDVFTTGRGLTGPLRKVLRGLVPSRRQQPNQPAWKREHLLFICTHNYQYYRFAYFKAPKEKGRIAPLTTFGWEPDTPARTTYENLCFLQWPDDTTAENWVSKWTQTFDVEKVNKKFYTQIAQKFTDLVGGWRKIGSKRYERQGCLVLPVG